MIPKYITKFSSQISMTLFGFMLENEDLYQFGYSPFVNWWKHSPGNARMELIEYILEHYNIGNDLCHIYNYPESFK